MIRLLKYCLLTGVLLAILAPIASAIVESKTGTEYSDELALECGDQTIPLKVTGVGLREKTFLKVDVYTIVAYVDATATFEEDKAEALRNFEGVKRIQMDLRRGFSKEKLVKSFEEVIDKNYDDTAPFAADLEAFLAYFDRDAQEKDQLIFTWDPAVGLTTSLNGEVKGVIENFEMARALWTVWFGEKSASGGLKKDLVSAL